MCFDLATMTLLLTGSEGMEMSESLLARADTSFTWSKDTSVDAVVVLRWFVE